MLAIQSRVCGPRSLSTGRPRRPPRAWRPAPPRRYRTRTACCGCWWAAFRKGRARATATATGSVRAHVAPVVLRARARRPPHPADAVGPVHRGRVRVHGRSECQVAAVDLSERTWLSYPTAMSGPASATFTASTCCCLVASTPRAGTARGREGCCVLGSAQTPHARNARLRTVVPAALTNRALNDVVELTLDEREDGAVMLTWVPWPAVDGLPWPEARWAHTAVAANDDLIVYGGRTDRTRLGDVWRLDTGANPSSAVRTTSERHHAPRSRTCCDQTNVSILLLSMAPMPPTSRSFLCRQRRASGADWTAPSTATPLPPPPPARTTRPASRGNTWWCLAAG